MCHVNIIFDFISEKLPVVTIRLLRLA